MNTNGSTSARLSPGELHVWWIKLPSERDDLSVLESALSHDERNHANRFRSPVQKNEFIAARAALRDILAGYVGVPPGRLSFHYGSFGKPALSPMFGPCGIKFNMSHSFGMALLAVANAEVGVDIERIDPALAEEQLADRLFSVPEISSLRCLPLAMQPEAFFNCWTRKEAYLKAVGLGLCGALDSFDVSVAPDASTVILHEGAAWLIQGMVLGPDYIGAVAVEGTTWSIRVLNWSAPSAQIPSAMPTSEAA
jgi:4'-phosphopantetheinyl transferase